MDILPFAYCRASYTPRTVVSRLSVDIAPRLFCPFHLSNYQRCNNLWRHVRQAPVRLDEDYSWPGAAKLVVPVNDFVVSS
jgi:hypothetical protein